MSELKPLFHERNSMAIDVVQWFENNPEVKQTTLGVICALSALGHLKPRTITRADIPPELVAEIQAEALEDWARVFEFAWKHSDETLDSGDVAKSFRDEADKLRGQKDEIV